MKHDFYIFFRAFRFAAHKNFALASALIGISVPVGLAGFLIGFNWDGEAVVQILDQFCILFAVIFGYCIASRQRRDCVNYNISPRGYFFANQTLALLFSLTLAVAFGFMTLTSNLIAAAVYGDRIAAVYFQIAPEALFKGIFSIFLFCEMFQCIALFLQKLNLLSGWFGIFSIGYAMLLFFLSQCKFDNFDSLDMTGHPIYAFFGWYACETNIGLLFLKVLIFIVPLFCADFVLTEKFL